jgi:hypothetical protein
LVSLDAVTLSIALNAPEEMLDGSR